MTNDEIDMIDSAIGIKRLRLQMADLAAQIEQLELKDAQRLCMHMSLDLWVLEDIVVRYDNEQYQDEPNVTRTRWGDTKSSQGYYPYHAVCRDCDRHFNQEQMLRELGMDATLGIQIDNRGECAVEREEADDE